MGLGASVFVGGKQGAACLIEKRKEKREKAVAVVQVGRWW
jgi:hypothetical protein